MYKMNFKCNKKNKPFVKSFKKIHNLYTYNWFVSKVRTGAFLLICNLYDIINIMHKILDVS